MIRCTELVDALVDESAKVPEPNPRVVVRWYLENGERAERAIEWVYHNDAGELVLHVPLPAQLAGEPGAGDVIDESDADVDVELLLEHALGNVGCACKEGVCMTNGLHPACRERLAAELRERQAKAKG